MGNSKRKPNIRHQVEPEVEQAVIELAMEAGN